MINTEKNPNRLIDVSALFLIISALVLSLTDNEELHSFYRSPNIVRVIKCRRLRWAGHVARMEEGRSALKNLGKRPLGRPRHRWEDSIRMYLKEIGINTRNWVDLAQDWDY